MFAAEIVSPHCGSVQCPVGRDDRRRLQAEDRLADALRLMHPFLGGVDARARESQVVFESGDLRGVSVRVGGSCGGESFVDEVHWACPFRKWAEIAPPVSSIPRVLRNRAS
jgi:hypothetical protein